MKQKVTFDVAKYYEDRYDRDTFTQAYNLFASKEACLTDVAKQYRIDKRTLKKV